MTTGPIALCADKDLRVPALFFEKVFLATGKNDEVPSEILANLRHLVSEDEVNELVRITEEYLRKRPLEAIIREVISMDSKQLAKNLDALAQRMVAIDSKDHIIMTLEQLSNSAVTLYQRKCLDASIPAVPFFTDVGAFEGYEQGADQDGAELRMTDVPLIDIEKVTRDQILEVRKDPNFTKALRSFRLLFAEDYRDKDPGYVMDSLNQKVAQYEESCRQHGLTTALGVVRQLLDSKSLLGALTVAAMGILTENNAVITLSAIAGSAIELGKMTLYIAESKTKFRTEQRNLDIAYFLALRKRGMTKG